MTIDTAINLGGREIKLKPSHKAIFAIEDRTGLSTYDLFTNTPIKVKDMTHIIHCCAVAANESLTYDEIGEFIVGNYDTALAVKCSELLATVFKTTEDKKKAKQENNQTEASA